MRNRWHNPVAAGLAVWLAASAGRTAGESAPEPAGTPGAAPAATTAVGRLELRLGQAVILALTHNRALAVERLEPAIRKTYEDEERAAFDPVLSGEAAVSRERESGTHAAERAVTDRTEGALALAESLPTGTRLELRASGSREETDPAAAAPYGARAELTATQALLRGRPLGVNLARLRQARLDTDISAWEFRGVAQDLVAGVEAAYWECVLARRRVEILETSLALAEQQASEIAHRIRVGALPETEQAAARAESALRHEALINARSAEVAARLRLLRLAAPNLMTGPRPNLALLTEPVAPVLALEPATQHVAVAMSLRPDLNEARLRLDRDDLEVVRTRNGLLPRLDLFVRLGDSGYAASFREAVPSLDGESWDAAAGLTLEFPLANRAERARHRRALASRDQANEALLNLADLARLDVEIAHLEVDRTREQVAATLVTRRLQEEKVRAETAKFAVGRSTALAVAQAQRDLVDSQLGEAVALVRHLEAWVALYRADGSLLERRGLSVEGGS